MWNNRTEGNKIEKLTKSSLLDEMVNRASTIVERFMSQGNDIKTSIELAKSNSTAGVKVWEKIELIYGEYNV